MIALRFALVSVLLVSAASGQQNSVQQAQSGSESCAVTAPPEHAFTPPGPYELGKNQFWLGTEKLWTVLSENFVWEWAPHKPGHEHQAQPLTNKIFWMSVDYDWRTEPSPNITVTGRRLDGSAPPLLMLPPTHAIVGPQVAMLTGVYVPAPGCWEITGEYKGNKLSFVVRVESPKSGQ